MSKERSQLTGVCRTLLNIPRPVSDVRLMYREFKYGPTEVSLGVLMQSVQMVQEGPLWTISWKILKEHETNMISEKGATSQMSIILSVSDKRIQNLKYLAGDKFIFLKAKLEEGKYSHDMIQLLSKENILLEIDSYEVSHTGEIGYRMRFIRPEFNWRWFVTENILEEDMLYIGTTSSDARFCMLEGVND